MRHEDAAPPSPTVTGARRWSKKGVGKGRLSRGGSLPPRASAAMSVGGAGNGSGGAFENPLAKTSPNGGEGGSAAVAVLRFEFKSNKSKSAVEQGAAQRPARLGAARHH